MPRSLLRTQPENEPDRIFPDQRVFVRLLSAERSEQIYSILIEEVIARGFLKAAIVELDFQTGALTVIDSQNYTDPELEKLQIGLRQESPKRQKPQEPASALLSPLPAIIPTSSPQDDLICIHPMVFVADAACQQVTKQNEVQCLAFRNQRNPQSRVQNQYCTACDMQGYSSQFVTHARRGTSATTIQEFRELVDLGNRCLSRLFKLEHYYRRAQNAEIGNSQITETLEKLKATEEVLRQDRDRLSLIIENVGDPIVVADNSGKKVLLDPLAKELFGGTTDISSRSQIGENQAKLKDYLAGFTSSFPDKESRPLFLYHPGSQVVIEYAARSGKVYDADGQVAFTVTVFRDFSTWKRLEQLQDERRTLEMEKFTATGRLAGTIAHEINNPMEAIKNAIYLLRGKLDEQSQPVYDILKSEADRVTRIVRQMLGLYRNTGQVGDFDLNGIVDDTLTLFGRPLEKESITIEKRLGLMGPFRGSADQFRQLLSNLVVNSRDSMPSGGKLIIRTRHIPSVDGTEGRITICVADTGVGIPKELQQSVFDPFLGSKGEKGTGLGLWIVKGIVQHHAGRITMRSRPGKGTVFRLSFPQRHDV